MIVIKLHEALEEIAAQRQALDRTETQLKAMIADLTSPLQVTVAPTIKPARAPALVRSESGRYDDMVQIIYEAGKPLHIKTLVERLAEMRGEFLTKEQIEPGLNRHIKTVKKPRIRKFAPSTYGLPEWQQAQSAFPQSG